MCTPICQRVNEISTGLRGFPCVYKCWLETAGAFLALAAVIPDCVAPIVPALEAIWSDCREQSMVNFNFRTVTDQFNKLVYRYPIRIPER
eukprot:8200408-Pyramimonas_sp.AAC.1